MNLCKYVFFCGVTVSTASPALAGDEGPCGGDLMFASGYSDHLGVIYSKNPVLQANGYCEVAPFVSVVGFVSSDFDKAFTSPLRNPGSEQYGGVRFGDERWSLSIGYSNYSNAGDRKGDFIVEARVPLGDHLSFGVDRYHGYTDLTAVGFETYGLVLHGAALSFGVWDVIPRDEDPYVSVSARADFEVAPKAFVSLSGAHTSRGESVGTVSLIKKF